MFFSPILKVTNACLPQFDIMFQIEHQLSDDFYEIGILKQVWRLG